MRAIRDVFRDVHSWASASKLEGPGCRCFRLTYVLLVEETLHHLKSGPKAIVTRGER